MGHRRRVPEDLMATILGEGSGVPDGEQTLPEPRGPRGGAKGTGPRSAVGEGAVSWEERPERVGIAFNLSKQLGAELEGLRRELRSGEDLRPSRSEIAEAALRIAVEDVRRRGEESELSRRLAGRRVGGSSDAAGGLTARRGVDGSGSIVETTYDENGDVVDEDVVGAVADLPVKDEYVDEQGRLVSVAEDELGNTFEQVMDEGFNVLETRLLRTRDQDTR